jgi:hypothetical protein
MRGRRGERQRGIQISGAPIGIEDWSGLVGMNLLVEFVDSTRIFMQIHHVKDNVLHGVQLILSPRSMNIEEDTKNLIVNRQYVRRISHVTVRVQENAIAVPCAGSLLGYHEKPLHRDGSRGGL